MQSLSRTFSKLSQPRANGSAAKGKIIGKTVAGASGFELIPTAKGWTLPLGSRIQMLVEWKCIICFAFGLALYAVAALLANEWLYLLATALMVATVLSLVLPVLIMNSLEVTAWTPERLMASESAEVLLTLTQRRFLGPLALLLPLSGTRMRLILARRTAQGYLPDQTVSKQMVILDECGQHATIKMKMPNLERGVYKISHVDVMTCLPFGMTWCLRSIPIASSETTHNTIVVFPKIYSLRGNFLLDLKGIASSMGLSFSNLRAPTQSTSVRGIREFRTGDSLRHIHWASSARMAKLLVREFESETLPVFDLHLDLTQRWRDREQFELAVYLCHSLVHFGYERDILPELHLTPPLDSETLSELMADLPKLKAPLDMLSEVLARVEPVNYATGRGDPVPGRHQLLTVIPSGDTVMRYSPDKGDYIASAIHLGAAEDDGPHPRYQMIATIYGEDDLQAL